MEVFGLIAVALIFERADNSETGGAWRPVDVAWCVSMSHIEPEILTYWGADKFLARPWKETSYNDQDLQHYTKAYDVQTTGIYIPLIS